MISRAPLQVAYCGGFEVWHGIPILIHAVRKVIDRGYNLHVTLIGSGNDKSKIVNLIHELGLDGKFTFTGQVEIKRLANYLAQADVGVSPYCGRDEYSGLKLLDYKAAGLAIISSGEKKQPSILEHGKTGWIVPPCDEEALCQAIIHLAENHNLRREMGQEARIESETIHSWRISVEKLLNIFNNVIQNEN
jgi:glycosyltransferase involved in cell wall biosynthesis